MASTRVYPVGVPPDIAVESLTIRDLCTILQASRPVVQQHILSGSLPAVQLSRRGGWRVTQSAFDTWVQDQHAATRASMRASSPAAGMWDRTHRRAHRMTLANRATPENLHRRQRRPVSPQRDDRSFR